MLPCGQTSKATSTFSVRHCTASKEVPILELEVKHHFQFYRTELTEKASSIIGKMKQPQSKSKYYDLNYNIGVIFHFHLSSISQCLINSLYSPRHKCYSLFAYNHNIEREGEKKLTQAHSSRSHGRGRREGGRGKNLTPSLF